MNNNLTFLIISSRNDISVEKTIQSTIGVGRVILIDGGLRNLRNFENYKEISLIELAKRYNVEYVFRSYDYAAAQYNFGLNRIRTEWAFVIDSDEILSEELIDWLSNGKFEQYNQYYVRRHNYFLGKFIRYGQFSPDKNLRLFRTNIAKYEDRKVHARVNFSGKCGTAPGNLIHHTVNDLDSFFLKMIEFSKLEPIARKQGNESNEILARLRRILMRLPFQATLRFCYSYIWRGGILDGKIGFLLAKSASFYETLVSLREYFNEE